MWAFTRDALQYLLTLIFSKQYLMFKIIRYIGVTNATKIYAIY